MTGEEPDDVPERDVAERNGNERAEDERDGNERDEDERDGNERDEDRLDRELRALFADDRLTLPVPPGAVDTVLAGASRRRVRRITAAAGGGALAVAAGVLAAVSLTGLGRSTSTTTAEPGLVITSPPPAPSVVSSAPVSRGLPDAVPTHTTRPDHDRPPVTSQTTSPATSSAPLLSNGMVYWPTLIGPAGYGQLRLGMSEQAALATGMLDPASRTGDVCGDYSFAGPGSAGDQFGVTVQEPDGVVAIAPPPAAGAVHTPEGVGVGSTVPQLQAAYPNLATTSADERTAQVPGRSGYVYDFQLSGKTNAVLRVELIDAGQQCSGSGGSGGGQ